MRLFDSHCHLQDTRFAGCLPLVIAKACASGVERMLCCGSEENDWEAVRKLAREYKSVLPAFGMHPLYLGARTPDWLQTLKSFLLSIPSAVGEIGLDHGVEPRNDAEQENVFIAQLRLANELGRPVSIHCRQAFGRLLEILKQEGAVKSGGVLHTYSGAPEMVGEFEGLGLAISFSGAITRETNKRGRRSLPAVSRDKLIIETDSPDILPVGATGEINEPANLPIVVHEVARLLNEPVEKIAELTYNNAERLFSF